ncbi:MAG: phosphohistidine phosphatase SixA [Betaproteobacteria bacterium]
MELILWRHAEAEYGEPDLGRQLTGKGEKQARRVAEWLHQHLPDSARVLVSPATRTQQTARALAELSGRKFRTVDALAPGARVLDVLRAADWPDSKAPVVIVGHQPTLGQVVSHLVADQDAEWSFKKGAVWWLQSRSRAGGDEVVVRAVINPEFA